MLVCILWFIKSAANMSTSAMYISIPADAELNIPCTINVVGLFSRYTFETPTPIAMPAGVVREKKIDIINTDRFLKFA